jgi:plastocyanin
MRLTVACLIAASLLAGCGGSTETTSYTTEAPAAASPAETQTPTATPTETATASPSPSPTESAPAGTPIKGGKATFIGTEFKFDPAAASAQAGKIDVTFDNKGSAPHELVFIKTDAPADSLKPGTDGRVPEKGSVGEVAEIPGGKSDSSTIDFKPGNYVYVCNVPGHYQSGMYGSLVVK